MDTIATYRDIVERLLFEYAAIAYGYGEFKTEVVFDQIHDRYLLMNVGWDSKRRVHGCIVHIDIIDGKIWIQRYGTEQGIALDLETAVIPKEHIVLGFPEPKLRQYTGYAVA
ncbi:MAG: XisI protein [Nostocaceae cyanobacterium]|nr:XisI protein [Nostocaceae cyanobacterium]